MKRIYADLHLCPDSRDFASVSEMVSRASRLGYSLVAVAFPSNSAEEEIRRLRNISKEAGVDLVSRVDLKPRTSNELLYSLRRLRRRFELVAVVCGSKNVARQAAKDRRVDLLSFSSVDFRWRFFDRAEAELASNGLACLEVDVKPLLGLEGVVRVRFLSSLRREVAIAEEFGVPVVLSSGVSDGLLLRRPRELAAFASLFDLGEVSAVDAVSRNPVGIVRRNRDKLGSGFVAPGIRIIRRGKDC
jgi:RNase P/RNase MRP subunit p30